MRLILPIILLILGITTSSSSIYSSVKGSLSSYLKKSLSNLKDSFIKPEEGDQFRFKVKHNNDLNDGKQSNAVIKIFKTNHKNVENKLEDPKDLVINKFKYGKDYKHNLKIGKFFRNVKKDRPVSNERYRLDPVLNFLKRRTPGIRRLNTNSNSTSDSSSSSVELKNWKDEWREHWLQKKLEAVNDPEQKGDVVNMVAARPWGVACGDPNQHDMPWGTCMLPMECESEYRIYRGDYFCGRTQFVCCSLQLTNYDMYQGFDVSFADSALSTDSEEKRNRGKGSKEKKLRKKKRARKHRMNERLRRKNEIKKKINKIIKEMRKILNKSYRNGTAARKKKTKQLKKFIKDLKKRYKKDRHSVKDIHEIEMIKIDAALMKKLNQIRSVNKDFMSNSTFREIVLKGSATRQGARMLVEAYPELSSYFTGNGRRSSFHGPQDYLDYDIEYGMLYY